MIKRWSIKCFKSCYYVLAMATILFALLLTVVRIAAPWINDYRQQLQQLVSEVMQQPVNIGGVSVSWHGFEPVLHVTDVDILKSEDRSKILKVKRVDVSIDIIDSLWRRQLTPGTLVVSGVEVSMRRNKVGQIIVEGLTDNEKALSSSDRQSYSASPFIEWLFAQDEVSLKDINIHWVTKRAKVVQMK